MARHIVGRLWSVAVLFGCHADEKFGFKIVRIERERALESRFASGSNDTICGCRQSFAKIGLPFGISAFQRQQLTTGIDRLGETAEPQVDGSQNFVAAGIVGVALEMRFRPGTRGCDRGIFMHVA